MLKDTDYLYATMRIRANEKHLLTEQKTERMIEAKTPEEAAKVLSELGYEDVAAGTFSDIEATLERERAKTMALIAEISPNPSLCEVFALKYDFHNIKTVIKANFTGKTAESLLSNAGSVNAEKLSEALRTGNLSALPEKMAKAYENARLQLSETRDPQLADFILDRAYFEMALDSAKKSESEFIEGYVRLMADAANIRAAVRSKRQKRKDIFSKCFIPSGTVSESAYENQTFESSFASSPLSEAAKLAADAINGKISLASLEREIDNALIKYMQGAKYEAFNERPLAAYVAAKEAEAVTVRIIMAGKTEGLPADEIRSRLRLSYV